MIHFEKTKIWYFLAGVIIGSIVFSSSLAQAWTSQLQVDFVPLIYFFNGVQQYPASDQQGFIYNGRTYVPLRFMAEASGLSVDWDGHTNSIYVGGNTTSTPTQNAPTENAAQYMDDVMQPFNTQELIKGDLPFNLGGNEYFHGYKYLLGIIGYSDNGSITFNLGGNYRQINGLIGIDDSDCGGSANIIVYGDGNELGSYDLKPGSLPQDFKIDVTGVTQLVIETYANHLPLGLNIGLDLADVKIE